MLDTEKPPLEILYQDAEIIAINKPSGWFVHRSLIQRTKNQIVNIIG